MKSHASEYCVTEMVLPVDFAEKLERDLAAANAEVERLNIALGKAATLRAAMQADRERDLAELARLSGTSGCCLECERLTRENAQGEVSIKETQGLSCNCENCGWREMGKNCARVFCHDCGDWIPVKGTAAIIVHIAPDADGVRCGECDPKNLGYCRTFRRWCAPDGNTRLPECHRRGKLLADLREAAVRVRGQLSYSERNYGAAGDPVPALDAAIAAIDAIKEETK